MSDQGKQLTQTVGQDTAINLARNVAMRALEHLVGSPSGRNILDLACGDGNLSRWLSTYGAHVTSIDNSAESTEAAKLHEAAEPRRIDYITGDAGDLYMIDDSTFDDVICHLALDQFENIGPIVAEVSRVIKLGGRFIFSVGHPCFQWRLLEAGDSGNSYTMEGPGNGLSGEIWHRTISTYINSVAARGFTVRRVMEPSADDHDVAKDPALQVWKHIPVALVVEAIFPHL
ncbi:MAG: class I SAM-dependent methyltransferase [Armatimonadota bacterium]